MHATRVRRRIIAKGALFWGLREAMFEVDMIGGLPIAPPLYLNESEGRFESTMGKSSPWGHYIFGDSIQSN